MLIQSPSCRTPAERRPARIGSLARLPVFLELRGREALVIGGDAAAAWKAELLAACGARVLVVADEISEDMAQVACAQGAAIALAQRAWSPEDLAGRALAVAALEGEEAIRFAAAAKAARVPVNVIDRPAHSDFTFGTIINRGPVVVSASTDGAAPVLAQALRRRIEILLPEGLAVWTEAAKRLRDRVAARLAAPAVRRAFWERFVALAFSERAGADVERRLSGVIDEVAAAVPAGGRVSLVGAGPGDAEYVTIRAMRVLQQADVVLHDDLVSEEVLALARREARRMPVGKRCGRTGCRQEDINRLMLTLARQGRHVVRLKSGDPMIFGRAGEEIAALEAAGIAVEVVPGITAALGMAARLGVSLTHRHAARSVRFVTGHADSGGLPQDLDWRGLADPATTLVVYMGGRTATRLAERLLGEGLAADTPVVVAEKTARRDERLEHITLGRLAHTPLWAEGPVLIGIGSVFARGARRGDRGEEAREARHPCRPVAQISRPGACDEAARPECRPDRPLERAKRPSGDALPSKQHHD